MVDWRFARTRPLISAEYKAERELRKTESTTTEEQNSEKWDYTSRTLRIGPRIATIT